MGRNGSRHDISEETMLAGGKDLGDFMGVGFEVLELQADKQAPEVDWVHLDLKGFLDLFCGVQLCVHGVVFGGFNHV